MEQKLIFDPERYTISTIEVGGESLTYRAFENIVYVKYPIDEEIQRLSIFVPEKYDLKSAPIFFPNTVGGYRPGKIEKPGTDFKGRVNATFEALKRGYVVVSAGVRGRGLKNEEGKYVGVAPAAICDLKAVVRYLRFNSLRIPGNVERIISNGTSAGGALSALLGASGNHPDYEFYLQEMGAADAKDHIYAASCYCPITNLEHADEAYEWEFSGINDYQRIQFKAPIGDQTKPTKIVIDDTMTEEQIKLSLELKQLFPEYLNSLQLLSVEGEKLQLDTEGNGTFKEYIKEFIKASAQKELNQGVDLTELEWLTIKDNKIIDIDFDKYIVYRTRMKATPAFDDIEMGTPENELFGTSEEQYCHFTEFSTAYSKVNGKQASFEKVKMMNPMYYIGDKKADTTRFYRIRHGSLDRDTSLAISAMIATKLFNEGIEVDIAYPWGIAHAGDYDLEELFGWIEKISGNDMLYDN